MDKSILHQASAENADVICAKINEETAREVEALLSRARTQQQDIERQAADQVGQARSVRLALLEKELDKAREKAASSMSLEKKRLVLEGKNTFVQGVLSAVRRKAEEFRRSSGYAGFLLQAVAEGAEVIAEPALEIRYAAVDEPIFDQAFVSQLSQACAGVLSGPCQLRVRKDDFRDIGVVICSQDGRVMFDNRFDARLERLYDGIYMELLKEA